MSLLLNCIWADNTFGLSRNSPLNVEDDPDCKYESTPPSLLHAVNGMFCIGGIWALHLRLNSWVRWISTCCRSIWGLTTTGWWFWGKTIYYDREILLSGRNIKIKMNLEKHDKVTLLCRNVKKEGKAAYLHFGVIFRL